MGDAWSMMHQAQSYGVFQIRKQREDNSRSARQENKDSVFIGIDNGISHHREIIGEVRHHLTTELINALGRLK